MGFHVENMWLHFSLSIDETEMHIIIYSVICGFCGANCSRYYTWSLEPDEDCDSNPHTHSRWSALLMDTRTNFQFWEDLASQKLWLLSHPPSGTVSQHRSHLSCLFSFQIAPGCVWSQWVFITDSRIARSSFNPRTSRWMVFNRAWTDSPPCSPWKPSPTCHCLMKGTVWRSKRCIFGGTVSLGNSFLKKAV